MNGRDAQSSSENARCKIESAETAAIEVEVTPPLRSTPVAPKRSAVDTFWFPPLE